MRCNTNHLAQSLRAGPESRMKQESFDVERRLSRIYGQPRQTVVVVDQAALKEIFVSRQKGWLLQSQQEWHKVVVVHSLQAKVARDGPTSNPPLLQKFGLVPRDVLIEDVHAAAATSPVRCPARFSNARRASRTASATAALVILPSPHR